MELCPSCHGESLTENCGYAEETAPGNYSFKFWLKCDSCGLEFENPEYEEDMPEDLFSYFLEANEALTVT